MDHADKQDDRLEVVPSTFTHRPSPSLITPKQQIMTEPTVHDDTKDSHVNALSDNTVTANT